MSANYSLGVSNSHVQIANIFLIYEINFKYLILVSGPSTCSGPKAIAYLAFLMVNPALHDVPTIWHTEDLSLQLVGKLLPNKQYSPLLGESGTSAIPPPLSYNCITTIRTLSARTSTSLSQSPFATTQP